MLVQPEKNSAEVVACSIAAADSAAGAALVVDGKS